MLKIDAKLRPVNGVNLVDISVDLFKDIAEPVYVCLHFNCGYQYIQFISYLCFVLKIESEVLYRTELASDYTRFLEGPAIAICDLYEKPQLNPFLSILMAKLTEFGNKMTSCPITKVCYTFFREIIFSFILFQMKYDIVGFNMDSHTVPSFVPAGDYHFEIRVSRRMVNGDHQKLYTFDGDVRIEP